MVKSKSFGVINLLDQNIEVGDRGAIVLRNSQDDSDVHQSLRSSMVHQITDDS